MTDRLILFKTAKLAREKGFHVEMKPYYKECTQSLLQKWLREKHKIHINIFPQILKPIWSGKVYFINHEIDKESAGFTGDTTYEEALEQGLQQALNLIKQGCFFEDYPCFNKEHSDSLKPILKFNDGIGAILCNNCHKIIKSNLTEKEWKGKVDYFFCETCKRKCLDQLAELQRRIIVSGISIADTTEN